MQGHLTLEEMWARVEPGVSAIYRSQDINMSNEDYMNHYTTIYRYCTQTTPQPAGGRNAVGAQIMGREVYDSLSKFLEGYMAELLADMRNVEENGDTLLAHFGKHWKKYTKMSKTINSLFNYLNRFFIAREQQEGTANVYTIYTLCVVKWREGLFMPLQPKLTRALLELIRIEREGHSIQTNLVSDVIDCFFFMGEGLDGKTLAYRERSVSMKIYTDYFENEFIAETENFYERESEAFVSANPITEYMRKVEKRLDEEERRVNVLLHNNSHERLITACEKVLIVKRLSMLQAEFKTLLDEDREDDLGRMYRLLHRTGEEGLRPMRDLLEEHMTNEGLRAVREALESITSKAGQMDPVQYVDVILSKHSKFKALVDKAFQNDNNFVAAMDKACRRFVNKNAVTEEAKSSTKTPELVAKYCDSLLRKGNKGRDEHEIEETLLNIMIVFKYIEDKDVFQKFYSKNLARRLVNEQSSSDQMEAEMISQLKTACGTEYTNKLQRMITDVTLSKDLDGEFKNHLRDKDVRIGVKEFNILVLTSGFWPYDSKNATQFGVPQELEPALAAFDSFYNQKFNGRKLTWLFNQSRGELMTTYLKSRISFQASAHQIGVLLQFNQHLTQSYEQIETACRINSKEQLGGILRGLVKQKLLECVQGDDGEYAPDTEFTLNTSYKSQKMKVNIMRSTEVTRKQEDIDTAKDIEEDRKHVIQAAIVRIMKSRKTLNHNQLIQEVIEILKARFRPQVPMIKQAIDFLIDKEYIQRAEDRSTYSYLA